MGGGCGSSHLLLLSPLFLLLLSMAREAGL